MRIKIRKHASHIFPVVNGVFFLCILTSCAMDTGKKPNPNTSANSNGATVDTANTTNNSDALCSNLSKSAFSTSSIFGVYYQELCTSGALAELRKSPDLKNSATQSGNTSSLHLKALISSNSSPNSYFNMVRLQVTRSKDFANAGFAYDSTMRYSPISVGAGEGNNIAPTKYNMVNTREDLVVDYDATAYFLAVIPNQVYVVSTALDEAHSVIKTFKGVQIINANPNGAGVEVFFFSDQTFENQNNHAGTVQKAVTSFSQELDRTKQNATNAAKADPFFR